MLSQVITIQFELCDNVSLDIVQPSFDHEVVHQLNESGSHQNTAQVHVIVLAKFEDKVNIWITIAPVQLTEEHFINICN